MTNSQFTECSDPLSESSISICQLEIKQQTESESSNNVYQCLLNDFYGFEHNNTKWILKSISSKVGLKRLQLFKDSKLKMLRSYYEIPDNPDQHNILNNEIVSLNTPAFHPLASLYLNPLGISIYIRNAYALRIILNMKINSISDPCFVQKWWSKGEDKYITDFSTISILALALRRNFMEGISILMLSDLNPNDRIYHIDHIQSTISSKTHVFQDGLDLAFNMLCDRPGLDIGKYFKVIADRKKKNHYHVVLFEKNTIIILNNSTRIERIRLCSLFRIILKRGIQTNNYKFSSKYLSILEILQNKGFFRYLHSQLKSCKHEEALIYENHKQFCEEAFYPGDEIESQRFYKTDIGKLQTKDKIGCLLLDRTICIGLLLLWLIENKKRERHNLEIKLAKLIINILIDSNIVVWFLQTSESIIANTVSCPCCKVGPINENEILLSKNIMMEVLQQSSSLKSKIFKKINKISTILYPNNMNKILSNRKHVAKRICNKPEYLTCDSHTIQSWNQPEKNKETKLIRKFKSEEIPILSLKHKLGKMEPSLKIKEVDFSKPIENNRSIETNFIIKGTFSEPSSLDSVDEITYSNQNTTGCLPPPLVISRLKSIIVNSLKIPKDFSAGDNSNQISPTVTEENDTTLLDDIVTEK